MTTRREFLKTAAVASVLGVSASCSAVQQPAPAKRPNILFCITDDQTWLHCGAYGSTMVNTPAFDSVARNGVLFTNAFVSAPSCNPSRSSVLTGMPFYRLKEASMNHTPWPEGLTVYTDVLARNGYHVGYTGKGCGPTDWKSAGRKTNPAGTQYNSRRTSESKGISNTDYAANFADFLEKRPEAAPFCFWYGAHEPHRVFKKGIGLREGRKLADAELPPFYPDAPEIRSDLLDYAVHIEWSDEHLGKMLAKLKEIGEFDNTLVVATSDNGMPFPRCKGTCYEFGAHMPLAIQWPREIPAGRTIDDLVSFTDLAPTFLFAAGLPVPKDMTGKSLLPVLKSKRSGKIDPSRDHVVIGVERHFPGGRKDGWGYPVRAIRTERYLYIRNLAPDRWPCGDVDGPVWPADDPTGGLGDCDGSPTKTWLCANRAEYSCYWDLAFAKRPGEELYDLRHDPYQLKNLAHAEGCDAIKKDLAALLDRQLKKTLDPRAIGRGADLDAYALKYRSSL